MLDLNVIGNGFDLYHGLPSSYYYFGCYLIKEDPEFFEEIGKMYNLKHLNSIEPFIAHEYDYTCEDIFWSDFENRLGEVDEYFVVDSYEFDLGLEYEDPYDIEMDEDKSADRLKNYFAKWVSDTLDREDNYSLIDEKLNGTDYIVPISSSDYFVTFNYTHTLQSIYGIDDYHINYLHGECLGDETDDLIVGHGNSERVNEIRNTIDDLEENYDYTQRSNNNINEYKCLLRYVERLKKNVHFNMISAEFFYERIQGDIDNINVYGLSLGRVDLPYLKQIKKKWPDACWRFSYYTSMEHEKIVRIASEELEISIEKISTFEFSNPVSNIIRDSIIQEQEIIQVD